MTKDGTPMCRWMQLHSGSGQDRRVICAPGQDALYFEFMPIESPEQAGQPKAPRSLYHKERPPTRSRTAGQIPKPAPVEAPISSRRETRPGMDHLLRNLRVFGLVLAGMLTLLMISIMVLRGLWAVRDRELKSAPRPTALTSETTPTGAVASTGGADAKGSALGGQKPLELDTERIRRAVLLAKHAQALEEGGSLQEAITRYREALDVWPYLNAVWGQLGRAYLKTREFNKAQVALEKAVQGSPGTAELMNDLGAALLYQGQIDRALNLFDAAMEIDPAFAPSQFNLALCHMARNERVEARAYLQAYLRLKPQDARALREMAFLDALEAHYDDAMSSLERALVESPDWPLLYFDSAAVAALMGRMDQAIAFLQKAEPLSSPRAVYQIYSEPAFREIRLTELGKEFEHELANRARERMSEEVPADELHPPSEPLFSSEAVQPPPPKK